MTLDMARIELLETELIRQTDLQDVANEVLPGNVLMVDILTSIGQDEEFEVYLERFYARTEEFTYDEVQFALARLTLQGRLK